MKITVLVPVYREPKRIGDIITKILANRYPNKEMVVVVDGLTNSSIEETLEPFRERITIHYNNEQLGKTESLNRVAFRIKTDVFLMLDNDIQLPDDSEYLYKVAHRMETCDIIEIPKEAIRKSPVSRMMSLEFLSLAMLSLTMARMANKSPSMNGAAFAVQALLFRQLDGFRPVINEDMDFAVRAFQLHSSHGFPCELKVMNEVPNTIREWLVQRKRWAMNNILWLKENSFLIFTHFFKTPAFFLSAMLMFLPFLTYLAVFLVVKKSNMSIILPLIFMLSQHLHIVAGLLLITSHFDLISTGGWIAAGAGFMVAATVFFIFARILKFRFNIIDFIFYYFLYTPVWLLANALMFLAVLFKIDVNLDWKVTKDLIDTKEKRPRRKRRIT